MLAKKPGIEALCLSTRWSTWGQFQHGVMGRASFLRKMAKGRPLHFISQITGQMAGTLKVSVYENVYKLKSFLYPSQIMKTLLMTMFSYRVLFKAKHRRSKKVIWDANKERTLNSAPFSSFYQKSFIKNRIEHDKTSKYSLDQCLKTQTSRLQHDKADCLGSCRSGASVRKATARSMTNVFS